MKKLTIALAIACMVVMNVKADLVYDFTAVLKTTTAKIATQSSVYTYSFGFAMNQAGEYWYTSNAFIVTPDGKYFDWSDGTHYVEKLVVRISPATGKYLFQTAVFNKLSQKTKEAFIASLAAYGDYFSEDPTKSVTDASYFDRAPEFKGQQEEYRGKKHWCLSVKWTQKVISQYCYRAPGIVKLVGKYRVKKHRFGNDVWTADWSAKNAAPKSIVDEDGALMYDMTLLPTFSYQFGNVVLEKSTRSEFVATIGNSGRLFSDDENYLFINTLPILTLAGQGSCAKLKDKNGVVGDYDIQTVSGNITGIWIDPMCEICGGGSPDAVVFACTDHLTLYDAEGERFGRASKDITTFGADNVREPIWRNNFVDTGDGFANLWGTAAYGTFTLKYNQKESEHQPETEDQIDSER